MDIGFLITFFSYLTLVNIVIIVLTVILGKLVGHGVSSLHKSLYGVSDKELKSAYLDYHVRYKLFTVFFSIAPLITLLIIKSHS
ncbi:MAG: hypothetical protein CMF42_03495 [Legionellales bacterium]|nr:hypothetical protein [Legionellales bacterium]|tara:strand:+ start:3972 stop:4223 length:252 start_codon:yes stop_codon:yes gene_type:complete